MNFGLFYPEYVKELIQESIRFILPGTDVVLFSFYLTKNRNKNGHSSSFKNESTKMVIYGDFSFICERIFKSGKDRNKSNTEINTIFKKDILQSIRMFIDKDYILEIVYNDKRKFFRKNYDDHLMHLYTSYLENHKKFRDRIVYNSLGAKGLCTISKKCIDMKIPIIFAVSIDGSFLQYLSNDSKNDEDIVKTAVINDGTALQYASDSCKNNLMIVTLAVKQNGSAIKYASETIKNNKNTILHLLEINALIISELSESLKKNKEIVLKAIRENPSSLIFIDHSLLHHKWIYSVSIKKYIPEYNYESIRTKYKRSIIIKIYRKLNREKRLFSFGWKKDRQIVMETYKKSYYILEKKQLIFYR